MTESIHVEVVYALPERQWATSLTLPAGSSLADALAAVAGEDGFSTLDLSAVAVGVWGRVVDDRARVLADGDRVEIYRPLGEDPKTARRRRGAVAAKRKLG